MPIIFVHYSHALKKGRVCVCVCVCGGGVGGGAILDLPCLSAILSLCPFVIL